LYGHFNKKGGGCREGITMAELERGKEGKRERGKEGKRERGNEGKRERTQKKFRGSAAKWTEDSHGASCKLGTATIDARTLQNMHHFNKHASTTTQRQNRELDQEETASKDLSTRWRL
jgi:hypothetical protein